MTSPLKIKAESSEDVEVISSALQDAAIKVGDLTFLKERHRFALVTNRFRWENDRGRHGERVRAGLRFEGVLDAQFRNIPFADPDHVLELLAIRFEADENGGGTFLLNCSGWADIRLTVEQIEVYLDDLSGPWSALARPLHALESDDTG